MTYVKGFVFMTFEFSFIIDTYKNKSILIYFECIVK